MQRILIFVVVLIVVWRILASIGRRLAQREPGADSFSRFSPEARRRRRQWSDGTQGRVEELVECSRCGTFVPVGRALTGGDQSTYCSEECRHQGADASAHAGG
jgi:hypothetical protein